jgi:predicted nucleic-acid-binding Zn-ribbon protein
MKHKGVCPKCASGDILTNYNGLQQGHRSFIGISIFSTIQVATYICMQCGFVEEYLSDSGMKNTSKMERLRAKWKKP